MKPGRNGQDIEDAFAKQRRIKSQCLSPRYVESELLILPKFFENFFIFGKVDAENESPQILFSFPELFQLPGISVNQIIESCFPTASSPNLAQDRSGLIQDAFCFAMILSDKERLHCCCIQVRPKKGCLPFYSKESTKDSLFSFCIVSRCPYLASHLSFLYYLVMCLSSLTKPLLNELTPFKPLTEISSSSEINVEKNSILDLQDDNNQASDSSPLAISAPEEKEPPPTIPIAPGFENLTLTEDYFHLDFCVPPTFLTSLLRNYIKIPQYTSHVSDNYEICIPDLENAISTSTLEVLFSLLKVPDILRILSGLLLDYQVIIFGKSLRDISLSVWGLTALLPFRYTGTLVPLLPLSESHLALLQAPTPYLIGVPQSQEFETLQLSDTTIFVNIDKGIVSTNASFENYPNYEESLRELESLTKTFPFKSPTNKYSFPQDIRSLGKIKPFSDETIINIAKTTRKPFELLVGEKLPCFFITDANSSDCDTIFNKSLFLQLAPPQDQAFFAEFFESQSFLTYIDDKLRYFVKHQVYKPKTSKKRPSSCGMIRKLTSVQQIPGFL